MSAVQCLDSQPVQTWADEVEASVNDASCGPGRWTIFLAEQGLSARVNDLVPKFIERARRTIQLLCP